MSLKRQIALLLLPALLAGSALAAERPSCKRSYTLAYHDHGMLYSKLSDRGIDRDVAVELIRRSGCQVQVSVMPRSRIWQWIESGELDFSMSGISNESRDKFAGFAWYLYNKYYFLARSSAGARNLAEFEADPRLTLGLIRSFRYSKTANELVDRLSAQRRTIEVADHAQLLSMMKLDRIQGMIIEPFNYGQLDARALKAMTRIVEIGDPPVLHGLIMSKKSLPEAEQQKWRALIDEMRQDGTMLKILQKYFEPEEAHAMLAF